MLCVYYAIQPFFLSDYQSTCTDYQCHIQYSGLCQYTGGVLDNILNWNSKRSQFKKLEKQKLTLFNVYILLHTVYSCEIQLLKINRTQ